MYLPAHERFRQIKNEPKHHVLSGQFLVSPVGWFPHADPASAIAVPFVSLGEARDDGSEAVCEEGVLLFSTN